MMDDLDMVLPYSEELSRSPPWVVVGGVRAEIGKMAVKAPLTLLLVLVLLVLLVLLSPACGTVDGVVGTLTLTDRFLWVSDDIV